MAENAFKSTSTDKLLFTPGPLATSRSVKAAMTRDLGSRDREFIEIVRAIRRNLLEIGEVPEATHTAIPMQGSGTFGLESVLSSTIPPDGKLLVLENGSYGKRLMKIAEVLGIEAVSNETEEADPANPDKLEEMLQEDAAITDVAIVHCETTTGILNPIKAIGKIAKRAGKRFIIDAMSSFGGISIGSELCGADYLVSSANKCIEGVPGFSFVICRKSALLETRERARSVCLDLHAQWTALEADGQFRFTPPVQSLLAFHQALLELLAEGGVKKRAERYAGNRAALSRGMRKLGFAEYLSPEVQSDIITTFLYPGDPRFNFDTLYNRLSDRGCVIYPGKLTQAGCFRIGTIGHITESDISFLLTSLEEVLREMHVALPVAPITEADTAD